MTRTRSDGMGFGDQGELARGDGGVGEGGMGVGG